MSMEIVKVKELKCWSFEKLKFEALECWSVEALKRLGIDVLSNESLKHWSLKALMHWSTNELKLWSVKVEVLKLWNIEPLNCWNVEALMHGNVEVCLYKIFSLSDSWQLGERTAVFIFMTPGRISHPKKGIAARPNYKFVVFLVPDFRCSIYTILETFLTFFGFNYRYIHIKSFLLYPLCVGHKA